MALRRFLVSWDTAGALISLICLFRVLPRSLNVAFVRDMAGVGISVLSIVFSLFAAAMAIIISATDDEFVLFLECDRTYTQLISSFRIALGSLFFALLAGVVLYFGTALQMDAALGGRAQQSRWFLMLFASLFSYGLIAAFLTMVDCFAYACRRVCHLEARRAPECSGARGMREGGELGQIRSGPGGGTRI